MTVRECEDRLLALTDEIKRIYNEYNPAGDYLMITISDRRVSIKDRFDCSSIHVSVMKDGIIRTEDWNENSIRICGGDSDGRRQVDKDRNGHLR